MRRSQMVAFAVALAVGSAAGAAAPSRGAEPFAPPDCGVNSLYALLKLSGKGVDLASLESALPPRNPRGYSFAELQAAARRFGLKLEGRRVGPSDVPFDRPVIAHLGFGEALSGHYVVLVPAGRTGTMTQMFDPPYYPHLTDYSKLLVANRGSLRILRPVRRGETWARFASAGVATGSLLALGAPALRRRSGRAARPPRADLTVKSLEGSSN